MYKTLFKHYWLKSTRAPGYYKNLIVSIFMGITILYLTVFLVIMGFMITKLLKEIAPQQDPIQTFNGIMIYAAIAFLLFRYMMQPLSSLNLEYYQTLPIKRDTLVNYILLKPLLNPVNYLVLCFAIPFSINGISSTYGIGSTFRFLFLVIFLIWFNTLLAPLLKRKLNNLLVGVTILLVFIGILASLEYFKIFSLFQFSQNVFHFLIKNPIVWIAMVLPALSAFYLNKRFFSKNYYPEKIDKKIRTKVTETGKFTFMERFGKIGEVISLEIKLVLRHKRTKKTLYTAIFFLFYGLLIYPNESYTGKSGWLIIVAIFITGIGMIIFGQWIINWDAGHFDYLLTKNIDTSTYIRSNYYLLLALCVISFIATTPYFFFGKEIIIYHLVAFIYNIGVNVYVYLFGASFNAKRLELNEGSAMNMQGLSYKNFIIMIPLLAIPLMLVMLFELFSATYIGLIIITLLGLTGIVFHVPIMRIIEKQFLRRKYVLSEGFRKK